jgi:hypothetical protein
MERNLSRQPQKRSALLFLERTSEAVRQSARGFQRGLRPAEERKCASQQPTTLHRSFARARLRAAARAINSRVMTVGPRHHRGPRQTAQVEAQANTMNGSEKSGSWWAQTSDAGSCRTAEGQERGETGRAEATPAEGVARPLTRSSRKCRMGPCEIMRSRSQGSRVGEHFRCLSQATTAVSPDVFAARDFSTAGRTDQLRRRRAYGVDLRLRLRPIFSI